MGALLDRTGRYAHWLLAAWQIMMALCGALFPHASSLWLFVLLVAGMNFAGGCIDVMGNVLLVKLWEDDEVRGAPAMNLLHAAWSTGSTVAPLLAQAIGLSAERLPLLYLVAALSTAALSLPLVLVPPPRQHWAALSLAASDSAQEAHAHARHRCGHGNGSSSGGGGRPRGDPGTGPESVAPEPGDRPRHFYLIMVLMFGFYACLGAAERIPGDWLTTAIVRSPELDQDEEAGAFATSAFFGAHLAGRLLSVPLAWWLRPAAFCAIEFSIALTSAAVFVVAAPTNYTWLLASVAGVGLGISALYPQGLLLAKSRVPLSSVWISRLCVGALAGAVLGPPLTGALLDSSPNFLFYSVGLVVLVQTLCFIGVAMVPRLPPRAAASQLELVSVSSSSSSTTTCTSISHAAAVADVADVAADGADGADVR
jgi:fucose permease